MKNPNHPAADPMFKDVEIPLSAQEDQQITARLSAAYEEFEKNEDDPETQRIMRRVEEKLESARANGTSA
jgi:DNA-binding cell septation regulator SpoVG